MKEYNLVKKNNKKNKKKKKKHLEEKEAVAVDARKIRRKRRLSKGTNFSGVFLSKPIYQNIKSIP